MSKFIKQTKSSNVEETAIQQSHFQRIYPETEYMRSIIIDNFPAMGRLTALRFIEWVQDNPEGLISLPTGKTPEHFIAWTKKILNNWESPEIRKLADEYGLKKAKPDLSGLHFVQIDEFYPINPVQGNSFTWYVKKYYLEGLGLDPEKALLIDCTEIGLPEGETLESYWPDMKVDLSLRYRSPESHQERKQSDLLSAVDQWCQEYEQKIRSLGGIGFFLGGIGPDGHIGFNVRGSDHFSTTRLTPTNYETQAAAAADLGGIKTASERLVITIGLGTITYNPDCIAIIMAAGEAKAAVVRNAIEQKENILYPATALHKLGGACFYITKGAAKLLGAREYASLSAAEKVDQEQIDKTFIDLSCKLDKPLDRLEKEDLSSNRLAQKVAEKTGRNWQELVAETRHNIISRIENGARPVENKSFLHTEPHHDDVMLGYMAALVRAMRPACNEHHFATLTSGFTSVTSGHVLTLIESLRKYIASSADFPERLAEQDYFSPDNRMARNRDVWEYLDGVAAVKRRVKNDGTCRRFLRNLIEIYNENDLDKICSKTDELKRYLLSAYPGQKDPPEVQKLKGMCREWEAECLWGYFGWNTDNVHHLRLGFYTGDIFTDEPSENRDVPPIIELLKITKPDIVGVAFDPEGSGPDTHYKVMQAITSALKEYCTEDEIEDIRIWGYRNVWYRFHPSEANMYVPVSLNQFSVLRSSFMNTFISQKEAAFPSYAYNGPFCDLAQRIQVEQYRILKTCLGRTWFYEHSSPLIRATRGFVFIKDMTLQEFSSHSRELKKSLEIA